MNNKMLGNISIIMFGGFAIMGGVAIVNIAWVVIGGLTVVGGVVAMRKG